jgi:hypothetical protein
MKKNNPHAMTWYQLSDLIELVINELKKKF